MHPMKRPFAPSPRLSTLCTLLLLLDASPSRASAPTPAALVAFNTYTLAVESRLAQQHRTPANFLASSSPASAARLRRGDLILERLTEPLTPTQDIPGALLHHWRGTAFAPGATAADFDLLLRDFNAYPQHFSPQVLDARVLTQTPTRTQALLRVRQHHVITIVMDTTYDVAFGRLDLRHGYSISRSTRIAEIDAPGTSTERTLTPAEDHGFLWRLNTYWSYEERDGGLYLQIEAVSLTRSIPGGLGWAVRPYVESIPRESLEFTLRSACNAIRR
jgi:hypothetical protein